MILPEAVGPKAICGPNPVAYVTVFFLHLVEVHAVLAGDDVAGAGG